MNITVDSIVERLKNGETKEAVGQSIANDLNDLIDEAYERYDAYVAETEAKSAKTDAMRNIFNAIADYAKLNGDESYADVEEMTDDEAALLTKLMDAIFTANSPKTSTKVKVSPSDAEIIADFMNLFN